MLERVTTQSNVRLPSHFSDFLVKKMIAALGGVEPGSGAFIKPLWEPSHLSQAIEIMVQNGNFSGMGYFHDFQAFVLSAIPNTLCAE